MARSYSRKQLAQLRFDGNDAEYAAQYFGVGIRFIKHEEETPEYQQLLRNLQKKRDSGIDRSAVTDIAESVVEEEIEGITVAPSVSTLRNIDVDIAATEVENILFQAPFEYDVGKNPSGRRFRYRAFASEEHWQAGTPELSEEDAPIVVEWIPATPVQTEGKHKALVRYRLRNSLITDGKINFVFDVDVI